MKILILEDEPIIAIDLEDIVLTGKSDVTVVVAANVAMAERFVRDGVDFALLDINLGSNETGLSIATLLTALGIPFCFVSSEPRGTVGGFVNVPYVGKPFRPCDIVDALPNSASADTTYQKQSS